MLNPTPRISNPRCQYGWEYDHTWYSETAPSRSDWVCDKELYVTNTFVASQAGDLVGSFVFGQLGDTSLPMKSGLYHRCVYVGSIGRRPVFLLTLSLLAFGRSVTTIAADIYPLFLVTCFLGTVATNSICVSTVAVGKFL
ncbi:unnamed protein product, partial [Timema podura]|nr:unnamed protein product [Timema podura]